MAEIDPGLLSDELGILVLLALQVVLAVAAVTVGCVGGRRWGRFAFPVVLVLAAAACAGTLYRCAKVRESIRGRLDGRVTGPHLPAKRAESHLAWVAVYGRLGIGIAVATFLAGVLLDYSAGRAKPAEPGAAADRGRDAGSLDS